MKAGHEDPASDTGGSNIVVRARTVDDIADDGAGPEEDTTPIAALRFTNTGQALSSTNVASSSVAKE